MFWSAPRNAALSVLASRTDGAGPFDGVWGLRWAARSIWLTRRSGDDNLSKDVVIPQCHNGGKTETRHEVLAKPGMFVPVAKVESKHWQWAGPEGAIITEVAHVHDNRGVRHTDKEANDFVLKG